MKILKNNLVLANNVKIYKDFHKVLGLMFKRPLKNKEAVIFILDKEGRINASIHMFFVFFSIDVVWLNKNKGVVDIRKNVKPFTPLIVPRKKAKYIIEFPNEGIKNIKIGDKLKF